MSIDELTIGQAREIAALVGGEQSHKKETLTGGMIGKKARNRRQIMMEGL